MVEKQHELLVLKDLHSKKGLSHEAFKPFLAGNGKRDLTKNFCILSLISYSKKAKRSWLTLFCLREFVIIPMIPTVDRVWRFSYQCSLRIG
jgi:hypothetical protein